MKQSSVMRTAVTGKRLRTIGLWVLAGLGVSYLLLVGAICMFQRQLLYFPDPTHQAPTPGLGIEEVRLSTADGERLVAWHLRPQPGKPIMLFFNGNAASLAGDGPRWRSIARAGAGFFAVGYRGYDGSTGAPTEAGLRMDANAAYDWVADRYPPQDIVIHGYSLGSGVAVRLAAERPARALILEAPYLSTVAVAAERFPWAPVRLLMWDRFASDEWIGRVHAPVMILHGDRDAVVPFRQGRALFELANAPKTFVRIPNGDHTSLVLAGLYDRVWPFVGVTPAAPPSVGGR